MNSIKSLALLLCVILVFSLAACDSQNAPGTTNSQAPSAAVITTDAEHYSVVMDSMTPINATVEGGDGTLTYTSKDESIATVNKYGKIVGVKPGKTEITITASDGTVKIVAVTVEGLKYSDVLRLAVNVLYNDTELGCFNTEYGPYIEIGEDGQYTLTFDATMHLSENTRRLGVDGLENLTSIFLYDQSVRDGEQMISSVTACDIRWDSITVNGQELTITNSEFKSAIKANGIFDTNDPLNAWEGCAVEEVIVDTDNHVLNINVPDPVRISITFTIQNLTFAKEGE